MKKINRRLKQLRILVIYIISIFLRNFSREYQNVWLISERGDEARDNGYVFYKYLKNNHPEINVKYVINKKSYDISRIEEKDIVFYQSFEHYIAFLNSKYLISTHHMGCSPDFGMFGKLDDKNLVFTRGKRIFLQHGIIYNFLPSLVNKKIDLFITSAKSEQQFIIQKFKYEMTKIKCTGLPRYDDLENLDKNFILVMPTWRFYLYYYNEKQFLESEYFKQWSDFLNSDRVINLLKEKKMKIIFYPHYETQKLFNKNNIKNPYVEFALSKQYDIHELLKECKMFITDYSSTFFDIGYLNKPIIYFQFDYEDFYLKHYKQGYLDLNKDGFGKVCRYKEELLNEVDRVVNNNFLVEEVFMEREKNFYLYHDKNNCNRIFDNIILLEKEL